VAQPTPETPILGLQRSATSPLTYSFTNTAGTYLLVGVEVTSTGAGSSVTSVTYAGTALTRVAQQTWSTAFNTVEFWELQSPATGANNVVVTAVTNTDIFSYAVSFTGVDKKKAVRQTAGSAPASGTTVSVTLPNVLTGSYVISMAGTGGGGGPGFTGWNSTLLGVLNQSNTTAGDNAAVQFAIGSDRQSAVFSHVVDSDFSGIVAVEIQAPADQAETATADVLLDLYGPFNALTGALQTTAFQSDAFQETASAGGGTIHNVSLTETATNTDLVVPGLAIPVSDTASSAATDTLAAQQSFGQPLTESSTPDVLFGFTRMALAGTQSESASATDAASSNIAANASLAESASASDIQDSAAKFTASQADSASAADSLDQALARWSTLTADSTTATDALDRAILVARTLSESSTASDTVDALAAFGTAHAESTTASETLATVAGFTATLTESSPASETLATAQIMGASLTASATASESVGYDTNAPTISESATATDSLATNQALVATLSEAATASDSLGTAQAALASLSESAAAQDALDTNAAFAASLTESSTASDSAAATQAFAAELSESASPTDIALGRMQYSSTLLESAAADVLLNSAISHPGGGGVTYNESLSESTAASVSLAMGIKSGVGIIEKIGGIFPLMMVDD
jgi:hypothetical protein